MGEVIDLEVLDWKPVRSDIVHRVYGKPLLDKCLKIVHTRVESCEKL
jgi:hypothetical protein